MKCKSQYVFEGAESEPGVYLGEILLGDSEPIGIHFLDIPESQWKCRGNSPEGVSGGGELESDIYSSRNRIS